MIMDNELGIEIKPPFCIDEILFADPVCVAVGAEPEPEPEPVAEADEVVAVV
jgi:hypothetical protein